MRWRSDGSERQDSLVDEENENLPNAQQHDDDDDDNTRDDTNSPGEPKDTETNLPPSDSHGSIDDDEEAGKKDTKPLDMSSPKSTKKSAVVEDEEGGSDHASPPDQVTWQPQNEESTCEFTHTILNYAQKRESGCKKAEYSETTVDDFGNRWRLIIYVNGNGRASNHHLSLFLQVADADDLPFGWKKAVSYVLTLEHPRGSSLGYAKRNPDKTFKLCPKAIDWGWSQFITSDRIQQEGYVLNDTLSVRASVTVKSSSVQIDEEDAELYLKCAVEEGNAEAVKTCLAQGAGVNCQFKDDLYTPLHTACSSSTVPGSMDVLHLLLERGADGNATNKWRETPLLIAANNGHIDAVKGLLEAGADSALCSEAGWSALTFAAHKGYDGIVTLLLEAGAPVNCKVTEDLSTPLHKACAGSKAGHLSAVKQLLEAKADVHALNKWRETPLLTAANHGQAEAVEALLKFGADPCKCTDTGWSPLSIAAYKGHDEVVRLLLEDGAPTEEDDPTLSALLQAATKGLPDTVELLLQHGADHTVTTKKGDTALSILVEQNHIDTAVEMVTLYHASIPRCSRDRKKVQRARLLINLRIKQQQREGLLNISDDDETDNESEGSNTALHNELSPTAATPPSGKKKKKNKPSKENAEAQARAAEEALLMELEQEESKAQKNEAAASSKRAKKKKKKERERQQRLKEEQAQRDLKEKQAKERERLEKLKEQERKERQKREQEEKEREFREAAEREKAATAKRKEKEVMDKRQREQEKKEREKLARAGKGSKGNRATSPPGVAVDKLPKAKNKGSKKQTHPSPKSDEASSVSSGKSSASKSTSPVAVAPPVGAKTRGWEKTSPTASSLKMDSASQMNRDVPLTPDSAARKLSKLHPTNKAQASAELTSFDLASGQSSASGSQHGDQNGMVGRGLAPLRTTQDPPPFLSSPPTPGRALPNPVKPSIDLPGISMYRQEKIAEILQRCAVARAQPGSSDPLSVVDESTVKIAMYRWIVRAAHGSAPFLDSVIPSWTDFDLLSTFFQRQFIAESRKGMNHSNTTAMVSMEALKEAGTAMAVLCQGHAKNLVETSSKLEEQLPPDWTDTMLSLSASEVTQNGMGSVVVIDWANRAQVYIPTLAFAKLRDRYTGPPSRVLTYVFGAKKLYELLRMIVVGTPMDYRLSPSTKGCLEREVGVSTELWSDPFSVMNSNVFCGHFPGVDSAFGGLPPFGKEGGGGEVTLLRRGGSISVLPPLDNMVASIYVRKMIDLMDAADKDSVPISFVAVIPADCFRDMNRPPAVNDLRLLDPRLNEAQSTFVRFTEVLHPGQHTFHCGEDDGTSEVSQTVSLFVVFQNETARSRFAFGEVSVMNIVRSMSVNVAPSSDLPMVPPPIGFSNGFPNEPATITPTLSYQDSLGLSPRPQPQILPSSSFGAVGGASISLPSSNESRRGGRRGRLFELVDDGDDDNFNDVDVVSGMLSNLNMDLFQTNTSQDVDIEAISLMGIGNNPLGDNEQSLGRLPPGASRTTSRFG